MRIAICDDEKRLRKDLRALVEVQLDLCGADYTIEEFEDGAELLKSETVKELDLLFLDIEMPKTDGMETARRLRQAGCKMLIIFVTAYPDFVFQGYEVQAFHYILKPYQEKKIRAVLHRAVEELGHSDEKYYIAEQKSGTLRLPLSRVRYFKSDRRTVSASCEDGTESFYGRLDEVEAEAGAEFQRVHNRYLVKLSFVTKIEASRCICAGEEIPVSRAYKQALAVAFAKMMLK